METILLARTLDGPGTEVPWMFVGCLLWCMVLPLSHPPDLLDSPLSWLSIEVCSTEKGSGPASILPQRSFPSPQRVGATPTPVQVHLFPFAAGRPKSSPSWGRLRRDPRDVVHVE